MMGVSEESDTEGDRQMIGHDDGHNWSAVDQICPMSLIMSVYCLVPIGLALEHQRDEAFCMQRVQMEKFPEISSTKLY